MRIYCLRGEARRQDHMLGARRISAQHPQVATFPTRDARNLFFITARRSDDSIALAKFFSHTILHKPVF